MSNRSLGISLVYLDGEGKVNEEGVQYYNNLIDYMIKQGNDSNTKIQPSKVLQQCCVRL
jgi:beta-glucosidase/6-phospho-beta-glucosidase/beta-galactosidase